MTEIQAAVFLVRLFDQQPLSVDKLPYSSEIVEITRLYNEGTGKSWAEGEIFQALIILRKKGVLTTKRKVKHANP